MAPARRLSFSGSVSVPVSGLKAGGLSGPRGCSGTTGAFSDPPAAAARRLRGRAALRPGPATCSAQERGPARGPNPGVAARHGLARPLRAPSRGRGETIRDGVSGRGAPGAVLGSLRVRAWDRVDRRPDVTRARLHAAAGPGRAGEILRSLQARATAGAPWTETRAKARGGPGAPVTNSKGERVQRHTVHHR